jgi:membrane-bound lytic murein transglycosylase B
LVLLGLLVLLAVMAPRLAAESSPAAVATAGRPAGAPAGLVGVAREAGRLTGVDPGVLLAVARVECDYGQCRADQPDASVPVDVRSQVDAAALRPGGATARLLGLPDGRRIGDWVDPLPVAGGQHAMGFMQFLPTTWRHEVRLAPGGPRDPYSPRDSMLVAGSYLARLESGAAGGRPRDIRGALAVYGGDDAYAGHVLAVQAGG